MQPAKRPTTIPPAAASILCLAVAATLLAGCTVDRHKEGNGNDVKISTPFGGMSVKTDDSAVEVSTGLPTYPGAQVAKQHDQDGHGGGAADVNMSFGSFQLRVKAISYRTPDAPDKVLAFYRKGLVRFGPVIQCSNHQPVGTPTHTPEGLDCSDDSHHNQAKYKMDNDFTGKTELKAGSRQHQHLVIIDPEGSGTKFDLVALDLPGHLPFGDQNSDQNSDKDANGGNRPEE